MLEASVILGRDADGAWVQTSYPEVMRQSKHFRAEPSVSFCEAQMSALAILRQPRKRSVVQISESRPGHFASIRRLPN
jgi:hypothetical protein